MGKKSRKKKSGAAAASSESRGLPKIDLSCLDKPVCAVCNEEVDIYHWDPDKVVLLECCGRSLCLDCEGRTRQQSWDEWKQLANLVLDGASPSERSSAIPSLVKVSRSLPCVVCGTAAEESKAEYRSRLGRLAEAGHVQAQYKFASMHRFGNWGARKDTKAALKWVQAAAEEGHELACARMGYFYCSGEGVAQSYEAAKRWFERGHNNPVALHGLGVLHRDGKGTEKDDTKALEYFRQAAEQDVPRALNDYGVSLSWAHRFEEALAQFEKCARMEQYLRVEGEAVPTSQLYTSKALLLVSSDSYVGNSPFPLILFWARRAVRNGCEDAKEFIVEMELRANEKCRSCGKPDPKNKCTKCRAASYCDKTCQTKDWKAGHKSSCNSIPVLYSYSEHECAQCGKETPEFMCQGCGKASYCDETCQKTHWEQGGHKDECKFL